ncbi:hypothetical protein [Actinophytocola sp.]|uniref:hypothetical protein n=1 Tax=Actinophytocola sp. TaxID=1872138 RepID=UPI003D6BD180
MPETYGTHETAALIVLTLENEEVPNPELRHDYGISLPPAGRDKLNKAGLLASRKENGRYIHQITEAGVAWCETELVSAEPPARSGPQVRAVFEVFRRLVRHLQRRGVRLIDVLRPDLESPAGPDLESQIRAAYHDLSVKPQDWVRLAKLRPRLDGADKDEVDQVLLAMTRTGLVHLAPSSNRKALTDADHAAAIKIGSEHKHLLAIEGS